MAERLVIDTSAYARLRTGDARVVDAVAAATLVLVPAVVLGELFAGFELGSRRAENMASLQEFLQEPFVQVTQVTRDTALAYGKLFAALRRAGTPVPTNDVWIAAAATSLGASVLTFDGDFSRIPGLSCTVLE